MPLRTITISGVDNTVTPVDLLELTWDYPFVEWGVLLSKGTATSEKVRSRYPNKEWLERLFVAAHEYQLDERSPFPISGHLCGQWAKDVIKGKLTFPYDCPGWASKFQRIQINANGLYEQSLYRFLGALRSTDLEYILQIDESTRWVWREAFEMKVLASPFFDASGGTGKSPERWPKAVGRRYTGYAGGLGPDNLEKELDRISEVAHDSPFWVDMETKIRAEDDTLDLGKVRECLEIAKRHLDDISPKDGASLISLDP